MSAAFDTIIVGGGSAGAVLANRLSARSAHRVLLIEAGQDTPPGHEQPEILDSFPGYAYLNPRFTWPGLLVTTEAIPHNRPETKPRRRRYEQARVLGGGSSINGQLANRGAPDDYDEWEARGAAGWNWDAVLPYFRKLERDVDFGGPLHGSTGPIGISRIMPERWPAHAKAMAAAMASDGLPFLPDQNGPFEDGHFPVAINNIGDRRVSTAIAYLDATTRQRPNLTILTDTHATKLLFDGTRCIGVVAITDGTERQMLGQEIILSCGAIQSPAHLLRAGIGPAADLHALGIPVLADLPGVGANLMDHPAVALAAFVKPHARINGRTRRHLLLGVRFSSGLGGAPAGDMGATIASKSAWHAVGDQIATVNIWVNKTYSSNGRVRLASSEWRDHPIVDFSLLSDARDLERLAGAVRRFAAMLAIPEMQAVISDPFPASYSDKVRKVAEVTVKNRTLTAILARLLDGPATLRRTLMHRLILEGEPLADLLADDEALENFIRRAAVGVWHASCSCRMGADTDPAAVTAADGRVRGVTGLRVIDASIFPGDPPRQYQPDHDHGRRAARRPDCGGGVTGSMPARGAVLPRTMSSASSGTGMSTTPSSRSRENVRGDGLTHLPTWYPDRRQRGVEMSRHVGVVDTGDAELLRHLDPQRLGLDQRAAREIVVRAQYCRRAQVAGAHDGAEAGRARWRWSCHRRWRNAAAAPPARPMPACPSCRRSAAGSGR